MGFYPPAFATINRVKPFLVRMRSLPRKSNDGYGPKADKLGRAYSQPMAY